METVDKETGEIKQAPKGKGSFWISKKAIAQLIADKATAMEIGAYLVLAKHTDESGQFSTAGVQAVYRATGVGHAVAQRAIDRLCQVKGPQTTKGKSKAVWNLVYPAGTWASLTGLDLPHGPIKAAQVRWVLNDYGAGPEDRVWISNELIDGHGKFTQPLKRLKRCGDVAARLLLVCYQQSSLEQMGGINPLPNGFAYTYDMSKVKRNVHGYDLWHGVGKSVTGWGAATVLGVSKFSNDDDEKEDQIAPYWQAIESLDSAGFVYQVVTVMDAEAGHEEAQAIYELDTKSRHGYKPIGEHGLGGATARLSHHLGNPVADANGRLYGRYAAIVPAGVQPHITGIYRLRFRVANPKNHGVKGAWARIHNSQKEAQEWIEDLAAKEGVELQPSDKGQASKIATDPKQSPEDLSRASIDIGNRHPFNNLF